MSLKDVWRVAAKRWWIFVLVAFVSSSTAYVYSKLQQPIYRSSAKLYVMPARPDYGSVLVIQNVVRQYSQLLASDRFLNSISQELRLDLPAVELRRQVHTSGTADNLAIQIDVDNPNPATAVKIVTALAREFVEDQELRMQNVNKQDRIDVRMYDEPTPAALSQPKTRINVTTGGILGLLLAAFIAFFFEYLDDTIKTAEDVERFIALPVVGSIPVAGP
ncbi:MAG: hypothetical protein HYU86_12830 [Chloroflexi bacterium]|nr:hypothetical protein [Chloroflexota bacterium]